MSTQAPLLAVDDLEVRYGAVAAVRGLSLEIAEGEIVGLIGPNGAGKSTTLHAIMQDTWLVTPSGGVPLADLAMEIWEKA